MGNITRPGLYASAPRSLGIGARAMSFGFRYGEPVPDTEALLLHVDFSAAALRIAQTRFRTPRVELRIGGNDPLTLPSVPGTYQPPPVLSLPWNYSLPNLDDSGCTSNVQALGLERMFVKIPGSRFALILGGGTVMLQCGTLPPFLAHSIHCSCTTTRPCFR